MPLPGEEPFRVVKAWYFDKPGDLQGWQPGSLKDIKVADGQLQAVPTGRDPLLSSPVFDLPANQNQWVRVKIRSAGGMAEFYYSNTTKGKYGGFSPKKMLTQVVPAGEWTTCLLRPFWGPERKIVHIRFDPPNAGPFEIRSIEIVETAKPVVTNATAWKFTAQENQVRRAPGQPLFVRRMDQPLDKIDYIQIRMAARNAANGRLEYALDRTVGLHTLTFPLRADGRMHVYHLDPGGRLPWTGKLAYLALTPAVEPGAEVNVESVSLLAQAEGKPDLEVRYFGPAQALLRAGNHSALVCNLFNHGGPFAGGGTARVTLPDGLEAEGSLEIPLPTVPNSVLREMQWKFVARRPVKGTARLEIRTGDEPLVCEAAIEVKPSLNLAQASYVPEPKPVSTGPYQVGVYYFPGWNDATRWAPLQSWPNRKPVLGWYAEGSPEVADWQIKWMLEHGISWIAYDWYWNKGSRHLEHGLHDAFFKARYQHLMKFCLLYANHNPPNTTSVEDSIELTKFWIENYFRRPNYLRVDGKPVMIIFSPRRITEDVGHENVRAMFDRMDAECQKAGIPGIYMVACTAGDPAVAAKLKEEGYDALSGYNYPGIDVGANHQMPYRHLTEVTEGVWRQVADAGILKALPCLAGGWDPRPWHGPDPRIFYPDRNPKDFVPHLKAAKEFLDRRDRGPHLCIIEAWNEWGEGSYIEPHAEYGFEYLDAVRQVFAPQAGPHVDVAPADVGRGPYDVPREPLRTDWQFNTDGDTGGWRAMMQIDGFAAQGGVLRLKATGTDPALSGPRVEIEAAHHPAILVRMKAERNDQAQLFWATTSSQISAQNSLTFPVIGDGAMHDYRLPVGEHRRWRGIVTGLRLDPGATPGNRFEIDSIRLVPGSKAR
jgi:hypothetical protein